MRGIFTALLLLSILSVGEVGYSNGSVPNSACPRGIQLILVEPVEALPDTKACRQDLDAQACTNYTAIKKFKIRRAPNGKEILLLQDATKDILLAESGLRQIIKSEAIKEVLDLLIKARTISGKIKTCDPLLVHIGQNSISGVGPAFYNGHSFEYRGRVYSNFLDIGAANVGVSFLKSFEPDKMLKDKYFQLVIAHELAHSLMQDLYGMSNLEAMLSQSVSRDGARSQILS